MLREIFYYLLGGLTFVPLCLFGGICYIHFTCPPLSASYKKIAADLQLTPETKTAALDLAVSNASLQAELENNRGKDRPQGDSTAPPSAKRLRPSPSTSNKPHLSSWLTVRSTFENDCFNSNPDSSVSLSGANAKEHVAVDSAADSTSTTDTDKNAASTKKSPLPSAANGPSYMSQMYKGLRDYRIGRSTAKRYATNASTPDSQSHSTGVSQSSPSQSFHCILKPPILYLYSSDDVSNPETECHAAIDLRGKRISIFVSGVGDTMGEPDLSDDNHTSLRSERPPLNASTSTSDSDESNHVSPVLKASHNEPKRATVRDGELFMKRNAIRIVGPRASRNAFEMDPKSSKPSPGSLLRPQWFVFCKNNTAMEDWYHALIHASLIYDTASTKASPEPKPESQLPSRFRHLDDPVGLIFSKQDMASLLSSLDSLPDPIPLRWLNAMVGRVFYSVYRTAWLESYITSKMMKKLSRVRTPGFLGDIKVEEVDVGRRAPGFSRPMLKSLTNDGEASMEVACHYAGDLRITISTTLTISLGSRFKPYTISLVLAVVLRSLEGNLLFHIKPPPSNRLWFGFTSMPKMEIDVEPVVSERKVQWSMVTRLIEGRLRELINESIVVPNMDDVPFFDTRSFLFRGGIFADAAKPSDSTCSVPHREESNSTSSPGESSSVAAGSTKKTSTTKSAPTSTLISDDHNGILTAGTIDEVSTTARSSLPTADTLRNRKNPPQGQQQQTSTEVVTQTPTPTQTPFPVTPTHRISPAAAGLSDLLSRDLAAGGAATSSGEKLLSVSSPSRPESLSQAKRKSWFGTSPKLSTALGNNPSFLLGGKNVRDQGSFASGKASISSVPGQSGVMSDYSPNLDTLELPSTQSVQERPMKPSDQTIGRSHEAKKPSISSISSSVLGTDESAASANTDQLNTSIEAAAARFEMEQGPDLQESSAFPSLDAELQNQPTPTVERDNGTVSQDSSSDPAFDRRRTKSAASSMRGSGQQISELPDRSPSTQFSGRRRQSASSLFVDNPSIVNSTVSNYLLSGSSSKGKRSETRSMLASSQSSIDVSTPKDGSETKETINGEYGHTAPSSVKPIRSSHSFTPPPRRMQPSTQRDVHGGPEATSANLSSFQKNRYGLDQASLPPSHSGMTVSATTSMILSSWNKAKASMADKESRQAAAKDAKDAIKRGWANWSAKRAEKSGNGGFSSSSQTLDHSNDSFAPSDDDGRLPSSQSTRMSLVPSRSSWLASSPPDPTSLGAGFERDSPETIAKALTKSSPEAENRARLRRNLVDETDDGGSMRSSSSGRQPYREHRAKKTVSPHPHDARRSEEPEGCTADRNVEPQPDWTAHWDAKVPSLSAPAPAFQGNKEALGQDRLVEKESLLQQTQRGNRFQDSPSSRSQRKVSASSSIGQSGGSASGISFIPTAPYTTIGLASAAGFPITNVNETPEIAQPSRVELGQGSRNTPAPAPMSASHDEHIGGRNVDLPISDPDAAPSPASTRTPQSPQLYSNEGTPLPATTPPAVVPGIQRQPGRAQMMAVPGIPSMQKSIPQSFGAPMPTDSLTTPTKSNDLKTGVKLGSMFKLPGFGGAVGSPQSPAMLPDLSSAKTGRSDDIVATSAASSPFPPAVDSPSDVVSSTIPSDVTAQANSATISNEAQPDKDSSSSTSNEDEKDQGRSQRKAEGETTQPDSIAFLPFSNAPTDTDTASFATLSKDNVFEDQTLGLSNLKGDLTQTKPHPDQSKVDDDLQTTVISTPTCTVGTTTTTRVSVNLPEFEQQQQQLPVSTTTSANVEKLYDSPQPIMTTDQPLIEIEPPTPCKSNTKVDVDTVSDSSTVSFFHS